MAIELLKYVDVDKVNMVQQVYRGLTAEEQTMDKMKIARELVEISKLLTAEVMTPEDGAVFTGDMVKALSMVVFGLLLGSVGTDVSTGIPRFTFGLYELSDGIGFSILAIALFAVTEIVQNLESVEKHEMFTGKVTGLMPTLADMKASFPAIVRGSAVGSFFGALPGAGVSISAFSAYMLEKKIAKDPSRFGRGAIEGVAAPEAGVNFVTRPAAMAASARVISDAARSSAITSMPSPSRQGAAMRVKGGGSASRAS